MTTDVKSVEDMIAFGQKLGRLLRGGVVIELTGDVGAGKTTLVKGIALGLGIDDDIQSPSFTINRMYHGREMTLAHYDFYRLDTAGIMLDEIAETIHDPRTVTVVEWAAAVAGVLPDDRLTIRITSPSETTRELTLTTGGPSSREMLDKLT